jgi:hypothetical protein
MYAKILALASLIALTGCATHDPRDRPWDPPAGRMLFEQIPPWDNAAMKICCSAIVDRKEWEAARCDTDRPVPPRSNRC